MQHMANDRQTLEEHLHQTALFAETLLRKNSPGILLHCSDALKVMASSHDLGKYTSYFQRKLKTRRPDENAAHSRLGALMYYYQHKYQESLQTLLPLLYTCIDRHHSKLDLDSCTYLRSELKHPGNKHLSILSRQVDDLTNQFSKGELQVECEYLQEMLDNIIAVNSEISKALYKLQEERNPYNFFFLQGAFSLLLQADKLVSAGLGIEDLKECSPGIVDDFIKHLADQPKADLKNQARQEMLEVLDNLSDEELKATHFFTLTAPTGMGKTLMAFQAALKLRERLSCKGRIVYAVPFINIAEQIKSLAEQLLGEHLNITYHYSLAVQDFSEDTPVSDFLLLRDTWADDFILTTFVQLFHSIVGHRGSMLLKFINLANSIIILDEVQALPGQYLAFLGAVMEHLARYYGVKFIMTTATQPQVTSFAKTLLKEEPKSIELLQNNHKYFRAFANNRTKLVPVLDRKMSVEEFGEFFAPKFKNTKTLVVVNTIRTSREVYKYLRSQYKDIPMYYLSTLVPPVQRKTIIEELKAIPITQPAILVATQTVEAGVDLDFDVGFRALAPWESIIQTAGRVNRYGDGQTHNVYIFEIDDASHHVYNQHILRHIKQTLIKGEILEKDYLGIINDYYLNFLLPNTIIKDSSILWDYVCTINHKELNEGENAFRLLQDLENKIEVFLELDDTATEILELIRELYKKPLDNDKVKLTAQRLFPAVKFKDKYLNTYEIKSLKRLASNLYYQYVITLPEKNTPKILDSVVEGMDFWYIPKKDLKNFIDDYGLIQMPDVYIY